MRRVVITGMGIVSCLGNTLDVVSASLRAGRSGIRLDEVFVEKGLSSHISGTSDISNLPAVDRKLRRFMGDASVYAYHALSAAIEHAGLSRNEVQNERTGLIASSGVGSIVSLVETAELWRTKGIHKTPPTVIPQLMSSTVAACLATAFGIRGVNYSMASACASSAHSIGHAMELIQLGKQDIVLAGGAEEASWPFAALFDAMGALSTKYNHCPQQASRPYDADRDGFVLGSGAGMLVVESLEHAQARGAHIVAELIGYGACSDGEDMVQPSVDGAARVMRLALNGLAMPIDYINTHATSTPVGDVTEVKAFQQIFADLIPRFSSTKGLSGHAIGAAGVHEAIYCLLMMRDGFIAGSSNIQQLDPALKGLPIVTQSCEAVLNTVMSNSFGFGGTNASLVFRRLSA